MALGAVLTLQGIWMPALGTETLEEKGEMPAGETAAILETVSSQTGPEEETDLPQEQPQPEQSEEDSSAETSSEGQEEGETEQEKNDKVLWKADVPLYFQADYPYTPYGYGTVASNGCGITSLAMVATYLTGHEYLPDDLARYFGQRGADNVERIEIASTELRLPYKKADTWLEVLDALENEKIVIALVDSRTKFTKGHHFIVLIGMTKDGRILVNDSNKLNYASYELTPGYNKGFFPCDIYAGYTGAWIYDPAAMPEEPYIYLPRTTKDEDLGQIKSLN